MKWSTYFIMAATILVVALFSALVISRIKRRKNRVATPINMLFAGGVLSSIFLFTPLCQNAYGAYGDLEVFLLTVYNTIKLFIVDGDIAFINDNLTGAEAWVVKGYSIIFPVLFVAAPLLTFGFVLSFFKNISAYKRYITHFNSDVYIFSELNEKSLALAESLSNNSAKGGFLGNGGRFFVFTDVFEREEEQSFKQLARAKKLGAVCFKKDIASVNFFIHNKNSRLAFFAIGEDMTENIDHSFKIIEKFGRRDNTDLYVFSTQLESELLLAGAYNTGQSGKEIKIKVRRINEVKSLITRTLYETGYEKIFCSAKPDGSETKKINAVVVGMGRHGTEMTKALSWFCQMDGYRVEINSFDIDESAGERFTSRCPELMKFSGRFDIVGEAKYKITIHSGVDVDTLEFDNIIASLPESTYVFVALGNDEINIATAVKLRTLFARMSHSPIIQAVVYNTDKKQSVSGISNFKGQKYDIDFIGDVSNSFSEEVILSSEVENEALNRHKKWGDESEFWQYDYNYQSSMASVVHHKVKRLCGLPGIEKAPEDRTDAERLAIRMLEHCRWNAYMRSEGYVFGGTVEKTGRYDLAKMHNCLVPFDQLPLSEQEKDDD